MDGWKLRWPLVLPAVLILVSPVVSASCTMHSGTILLPGGGGFHAPDEANGITAYWIVDPPVGNAYVLREQGATACGGYPVLECHPDLNIAFYEDDGQLIANHDHAGDQSGFIPLNADVAMVYVAWTSANGGLAPVGTKFSFGSGC